MDFGVLLTYTFRCVTLRSRVTPKRGATRKVEEDTRPVRRICVWIFARSSTHCGTTCARDRVHAEKRGRELTTWSGEVSRESMANSLPAVINATS